jgi:AAA domain/Primase C terminal 1 (PriCT-1)
MPDAVPGLFPAPTNGNAPAIEGDIVAGDRNNALISLAGSMRRRGHQENEILAALRETNKRCEPQLDDKEVADIARSAMRYPPAATPWRLPPSPLDLGGEGGSPRFEVQWGREDDMRAAQWAFEGRIRVGKLNSTTGAGGAGKGTFQAYMFASWSRGELPGCFHGEPIKILIVGDEDSLSEDWTPRVKAAGGDVTKIACLNYVDGVPLDLVRDIGRLEEVVRDDGFSVVHLDQALDHLGDGLNANNQKDVRRGLAPLRGLAHRAGIVAMYSMHSIKSTTPGSVRLLTGGSGQFTDLPRSSLFVGYHPDRPGWRAVGVGKNNARADVPTLVFRIEGVDVTVPQTGEVIPTTRVVGLDEDPDLQPEEIDPHPRKPEEEPKLSVVERVLRALGSDGEWHTRREAFEQCTALGVGAKTFDREFPHLDWIEKDEKKGRETRWRLKS